MSVDANALHDICIVLAKHAAGDLASDEALRDIGAVVETAAIERHWPAHVVADNPNDEPEDA